MAQHNGFIELHLIENTGENADKIGLLTAEFVHYTDCQQLKVWLPKSEYNKCDYGIYKIVNKLTQDIVEQELVELKVSGNTQMLFDTLCLKNLDLLSHRVQMTLCEKCFGSESHSKYPK